MYLKRCLFFFCAIGSLVFLFQALSTPAFAASMGQIDISMPNNSGLVGHVGTRIHLSVSNFPANVTVSFFTTPNSNANKCTPKALQNPTNAGLAPFTSAPNATTAGDGTLQLDTTWPSNANIPTTNYYICAISPSGGGSPATVAFSAKSFTVAQPVQLAVSAQSVQPGGTVTINGAGWLPPQPLNVSIVSDNGTLVSTTVPATSIDPMSGNFSVPVNIPANADPRDYSVKVSAVNEPTMTLTLSNTLTVGSATATATTTVTTPQTTATVQTTPGTPTTVKNAGANSGNGGGGSSLLVFGLGGLGVLLVAVGLTMFIAYSPKKAG